MKKPLHIRPAYALVAGLVFILLGLFAGYRMYSLNEVERLWGTWPLWHLVGLWIGFFILIQSRRFKNLPHTRAFGLSTLSALLLSFGFPPSPVTSLLFVGFVPLLLLLDMYRLKKLSGRQFFWYSYYAFALWNIITTFWICNTAYAAGLVAIFLNALFMTIVWRLIAYVGTRTKSSYQFLPFAALWIGWEFAHHHWELHWPWLTLGNGLSRWPAFVQWYEFTGAFGGSLWILGLNYLIYKVFTDGLNRRNKVRLILTAIFPVVVSLVIYFIPEKSAQESVRIAVIQPNFEPHYEKFNLPQVVQLDRFVALSEQVLDENTDYLVFPETSYDVLLNSWDDAPATRQLKVLLNKYPNTTLVTGAESRRIYMDNEPHSHYTRTFVQSNGDTIFWENHNSAIQFKEDGYDIYYKSKLVPGPEFFPFRNLLWFMRPLIRKLGGSYHGLRQQDERSTFVADNKSNVGPIICYESIFGEFVSGYTKKGAEVFFIMTNDGWWDNTAGHKQHMYFASLRAIEQRRPIARSANTGISCFIDTKGRIRLKTKYNEATAIIDNVVPNNRVTLYARTGDVIGRLALLLAMGMIIFSIGQPYLKKPV